MMVSNKIRTNETCYTFTSNALILLLIVANQGNSLLPFSTVLRSTELVWDEIMKTFLLHGFLFGVCL